MPNDEEVGLLSEAGLDDILGSLPRRFEVSGARRFRSERRLSRSARQRGLIGKPRAWPRWAVPIAAAVIFVAGYSAGSLGEPGGDLESAIAEARTTTDIERRALVQRAGTAYVRSLNAAVARGTQFDDLRSQVRTVTLAAARITGGPARGDVDECLVPIPRPARAQLVAF